MTHGKLHKWLRGLWVLSSQSGGNLSSFEGRAVLFTWHNFDWIPRCGTHGHTILLKNGIWHPPRSYNEGCQVRRFDGESIIWPIYPVDKLKHVAISWNPLEPPYLWAIPDNDSWCPMEWSTSLEVKCWPWKMVERLASGLPRLTTVIAVTSMSLPRPLWSDPWGRPQCCVWAKILSSRGPWSCRWLGIKVIDVHNHNWWTQSLSAVLTLTTICIYLHFFNSVFQSTCIYLYQICDEYSKVSTANRKGMQSLIIHPKMLSYYQTTQWSPKENLLSWRLTFNHFHIFFPNA